MALCAGANESQSGLAASVGRRLLQVSLQFCPVIPVLTLFIVAEGRDSCRKLHADRTMGDCRLLSAPQGPSPATAPELPVLPGRPTPAKAASSPAVAPLSVEAVSSTVTAVMIKETPAAATAQQADFVPAAGCSQPRQAGPCDRYSTRWFFDAASGSCANFLFGGCMVGSLTRHRHEELKPVGVIEQATLSLTNQRCCKLHVLFDCLQGNLNNYANLLSCQLACIEGRMAPSEEQPEGEVSVPGEDELVFLASALTAKSWITLDITSVGFCTLTVAKSQP